MILGIGVDIVRSARMLSWAGNPEILDRFFHPEETAYIGTLRRPESSLAARFAAREAFGKALGVGLSGWSLKEVWVRREPNGSPELQVEGRARELLEARGGTKVWLSLSHEKDYAVAQVIIEG